jgi:hypothetical protein
MPSSAAGLAKRALVVLLAALAAVYGFAKTVNRDSPDKDVVSAVRRACLKTHPDKGGTVEHQQQLNAAKAAWDDARAKAG